MTPLMLASRLGHESMVEMLVDVFGAELDPVDKVQSIVFFSRAALLRHSVFLCSNRPGSGGVLRNTLFVQCRYCLLSRVGAQYTHEKYIAAKC